jgi:hypothetical protein
VRPIADLAPLLNELVHRPLMSLDRYQDASIIENAELLVVPERSGIHNMTRYDE